MTFPELIYGVSFLTPMVFALAEGRKAGFLGVLAAMVVGAALGICSLLMTIGLFRWVVSHPKLGKRNPGGLWDLLVWALFLAMFVAIGALGVLGAATTRWVTGHGG